MAKTAKGLVDYVRVALAEGWRYWYGTTGVRCTPQLLARKKAQYPAHYTDARMARYNRDIVEGRFCADCINLVKGYMWLDESTGRQSYASNGCPDTNADGMFNRAKVKGEISTIPDVPGLIVRFTGHAGVYIGEGEVIEARGFAYGVVRTQLAKRPWTHWYQMPGLEYDIIDNPTDIDGDKVDGDGGCPFDEPTELLKRNMRGTGVRWLQWHLAELDYDIGRSGIDGKFGDKTYEAVRTFQSVVGIEADGKVGDITRGMLKQVLEDPTKLEDVCPFKTPKVNLKRYTSLSEGVRWLQWHLIKLGYNLGEDGIDGDFGRLTIEAVVAFQKANELKVDGVVGAETRAKLIEALKIKTKEV